MSVQNGERLATKQDLAAMYQGILPYLGGMPEVLANKFSKSDLHYTTEKIVGRWIDGRPLYSLTIDESVVSSSSEIDTNLCALPANINEVVSITGVAFDITNAYAIFTCPYYASSSSYCGFRVSKTKDYLKVKFRGLTPSGTPTDTVGFYATIQYTKTTDAANSFKFADENDYSTSEKIVGTWIDSKTLYQITVSITFGTVTDGVAAYASSDIPSNIEEAFLDSACVHPTDNVINAVNDAWVSTQTYFTRIYIDKGTNKIFASTNRSQFSNKTVYATIKYTKTS